MQQCVGESIPHSAAASLQSLMNSAYSEARQIPGIRRTSCLRSTIRLAMDVDAEEVGLFTAGMKVEYAVAVVIANHGDQLTLHQCLIDAFMFFKEPTLCRYWPGFRIAVPDGFVGRHEVRETGVSGDPVLPFMPCAVPLPEHPHDIVKRVWPGVFVSDADEVEIVIAPFIAKNHVAFVRHALNDSCKVHGGPVD